MSEVTLAAAINAGLSEALDADERVVLIGEDIGTTGGVFRVTDGLQQRFGAERVIDAPVAESGIVGAAFGMAVGGLIPVVEIQFMGFTYPAYDQLISHVSRIRNRSRHRFTAPLVVRVPYGAGIGAAEHHSESMEAAFAHVPGLKVVVPSTPYDAKGLLRSAIADPDPVVFLEPIRLYRSVKEELPPEPFTVPLGAAEVARPGTDVTLIAYGAMMKEVRAAAHVLAERGVDAEVIDLRSLVPLDSDAIIGSVIRTGRAVVVHEAHRTAGFGAEITAQIQEKALYSLLAPVERVTGWDIVVPLRRAEKHYVPTVDNIVAAAERTMRS
ncbi:MAG: alpha-ketoacid dehydrogenase subunit beta [Acidimicrobiia bacterium]|nr:alpha-ketoacid dehydrogenase subunit beta [Acidimicrobiia bacterium]